MRNYFSRFIATILLAAFSAYLVPSGLVHLLYDHEDTHEHAGSTKESTVDVAHIHCEFLSYEASLFTVTSITTCPASFERAFAFTSPEAEQEEITFTFCPSLRGPPALV